LNLGQLEKSFGFKDSKQFLLCLKEKYQVIVQLQALQNSDLPQILQGLQLVNHLVSFFES
jgi:hypothetical protein